MKFKAQIDAESYVESCEVRLAAAESGPEIYYAELELKVARKELKRILKEIANW